MYMCVCARVCVEYLYRQPIRLFTLYSYVTIIVCRTESNTT